MLDTVQTTTRSFGELIVRDNLEALDVAISQAGVEPRDIISILAVPRVTPAIGDHEPKLRVIYRMSAAR